MSSPPSKSKQTAEETTAQITNNLFLEIQSVVKQGKIVRAEELREKLISVNPMALSEIIKSAEIIEKAKSANIDKDHLAIWDMLYETLSEEEKNCLFYSLKKVVVPPKKIILAKGSFNNRLFFIDRGQVSILYPKGDKHIVLAQLGRGCILGEYTFTTISLCSATAASNSEVHLMCLDSGATDDWEEKQPGLYEKLIDFCRLNGQVDEIIKRKKMEKRTSVRHSIEGLVTACLLTKEGKKTETRFRGNLSDLSVTGTSFMIKCPKKQSRVVSWPGTCYYLFHLNGVMRRSLFRQLGRWSLSPSTSITTTPRMFISLSTCRKNKSSRPVFRKTKVFQNQEQGLRCHKHKKRKWFLRY